MQTARRLQQEIGGEIAFFFHDSDHDPRETVTILRDLHTGGHRRINFTFANKLQKEFSPLFAKRVLADWKTKAAAQLSQCVPAKFVGYFEQVDAENVADFCLQMYDHLGLLEGVRVMRSSDPALRRRAIAVEDYFVDTTYEDELVRARRGENCLLLHKGGAEYIQLPLGEYGPAQISPTRDTRLRWMQSVVGCTHYVAGAGEMKYLKVEETPEVKFTTRDGISEANLAYVPQR